MIGILNLNNFAENNSSKNVPTEMVFNNLAENNNSASQKISQPNIPTPIVVLNVFQAHVPSQNANAASLDAHEAPRQNQDKSQECLSK